MRSARRPLRWSKVRGRGHGIARRVKSKIVVAYGQKFATVLAVSMPDVSGSPPTSAAAVPPFAFSPWHTAHLAAKTFEPCSGVPLPGGRPVPSGNGNAQTGSQTRRTSVDTAIRLTPSTRCTNVDRDRAATRHARWHRPDAPLHQPATGRLHRPATGRCTDLRQVARTDSRINMLDLACPIDRPARWSVVVLTRERRRIRDRGFRLTAPRDDSARVGCTLPASSHARLCSTAGPPSHFHGDRNRVNGFRQHRLLQGRFGPASCRRQR